MTDFPTLHTCVLLACLLLRLCTEKRLLLISVSECQLLVDFVYVYSVIPFLWFLILHIMGYYSFHRVLTACRNDLVGIGD
jgi:hypothetical protein